MFCQWLLFEIFCPWLHIHFLWSIGLPSQNTTVALMAACPRMLLLVKKHVVLLVIESGILNAKCRIVARGTLDGWRH
jgi:hypothetical protein